MLFSSSEFECFTVGVDIKIADRMCLISEKILIRNCGCYKPCTMGNPGCCEGLKGASAHGIILVNHNDLVVFLVLCI